MNVLKFGGSSVGFLEALLNVRQIVSSRKESVVVVVSALSGITDMLLNTSAMAEKGDSSYLEAYKDIRERHIGLVCKLGLAEGAKASLLADMEVKFTLLKSLLDGVHTLKVLPEKTRYEIVSFGERLSSEIVAALIEGSALYNSLDFIKTTKVAGKVVLDSVVTEDLVKKAFASIESGKQIAIVPGFISADSFTSEITNLGRGGSDYTASIIAAALDADCLEIWTDVDGFMTADPRIIKTSYVIDELSFVEAMELCNFGAKVIYPPALYPVCPKDIPVLIKNTFNPEAKGTVIRQKCDNAGRAVTGISSIAGSCVLTVSGASMAGIVGVNSRIFNSLAREGISVFLVSQSSSETHISLGVNESDADKAAAVLDSEFVHEIA